MSTRASRAMLARVSTNKSPRGRDGRRDELCCDHEGFPLHARVAIERAQGILRARRKREIRNSLPANP